MRDQTAKVSNDTVSKPAGSSSAGKVQRPISGLPENYLFENFERPRISSLGRFGIQTKLSIGSANDKYEQEADRVADQVMRSSISSRVTSSPIRISRFSESETASEGSSPASVDRVLSGSGRPLDSPVRHDMERRFGHDFSSVQIHTGTTAEKSARDINAHAYTVGNNVVFGVGQYSPETNSGKRLLAHELTHVVQQGGESSSAHVQGKLSSRLIQRKKRGAAGGCGVCLGPNGLVAGGIAHTEIQLYYQTLNIVGEGGIPTVEEGLTAAFTPRTDLSFEKLEHGQKNIYIGEIKPLDDARKQAGIARDKLKDYYAALRDSKKYDEIFRMETPPPPPLPFVNPANPPGCPKQKLITKRTEKGIYQYYCESPWSELINNPNCVPSKCKKDDDDDDDVDVDIHIPEIEKVVVPIAALAALSVALKSMSKKYAGGPAYVYAAAAASIILLATGEAKAGFNLEGEEPITALLRSLEQDGTPVPDEIAELIKNDPELKKIINEGLGNGEQSEAQKKIANRMLTLLAENKEQFSDEEIKKLFTITNAVNASTSNSNIDIDMLKNAIEKSSSNQGSRSAEGDVKTGEGDSSKSTEAGADGKHKQKGLTTDGEAGGEADPTKEKLNLSEATKEKISSDKNLQSLINLVIDNEGDKVTAKRINEIVLMVESLSDATFNKLLTKIEDSLSGGDDSSDKSSIDIISMIKEIEKLPSQASLQAAAPSEPKNRLLTEAESKAVIRRIGKLKAKSGLKSLWLGFSESQTREIIAERGFATGAFAFQEKDAIVGAYVSARVNKFDSDTNKITFEISNNTVVIDARGNIVNGVTPLGLTIDITDSKLVEILAKAKGDSNEEEQ